MPFVSLSASVHMIRLVNLSTILEHLLNDWTSLIYVFFQTIPDIEYINRRLVYVFKCVAKYCKGCHGRLVCQYQDTSDTKSTGNLCKHAKVCWGKNTVKANDDTKDVRSARQALAGLKTTSVNGSITATFEQFAKGKVTYSHR